MTLTMTITLDNLLFDDLLITICYLTQISQIFTKWLHRKEFSQLASESLHSSLDNYSHTKFAKYAKGCIATLAAGLRGEINDNDDVNDDEKQGLRITNALLYT